MTNYPSFIKNMFFVKFLSCIRQLILIYMSNNRMYGGSRYQPQGRNANLTGTMFKRTPIFNHIQPEKQIDNSPFANYKTNESFQSETTMEERVNPDTIRILIKQELSRLPAPEDNNRKLIHTLQAQITDLKERIHEYEKENSTKLHESTLLLKEEMKAEAENMDKEIEQEITSKLRSFFQKVNFELKKDILKVVEDQFLTINYGQDLENRLEDIHLKIEATNNLINSKHIPQDELEHKIQQATLVDSLEPKLAKIEKEIQGTRKAQLQMVGKLKEIQEWVEEEGKRVAERDLREKVQILKEKVKNIDLDMQKRIGSFELQISNSQSDISIVKDKISELQNYNEEQRSLFLDLNKKLSSGSNRGSIESENHELSTSILVNSSTLPERHKEAEDRVEKGNNSIKIEASEPREAQEKVLYQFDTENYLMDGEGNYILTEDGKAIKLTEEQIQALYESKAIEVVQ